VTVARGALTKVRSGTGLEKPIGSGRKAVTALLGNIKSAITATFRSGSKKDGPCQLAEFEYRFNRRYVLATMMPGLG
jgi:hypothetical protein